jgi:hypothetical protein
MLREFFDVRVKQSQSVGLSDKAFVDFNKTLWLKSSSERIESSVSWLDIPGDKATQIIFLERFGQLSVRAYSFSYLNNAGYNKINTLPFWAYTCVGRIQRWEKCSAYR